MHLHICKSGINANLDPSNHITFCPFSSLSPVPLRDNLIRLDVFWFPGMRNETTVFRIRLSNAPGNPSSNGKRVTFCIKANTRRNKNPACGGIYIHFFCTGDVSIYCTFHIPVDF